MPQQHDEEEICGTYVFGNDDFDVSDNEEEEEEEGEVTDEEEEEEQQKQDEKEKEKQEEKVEVEVAEDVDEIHKIKGKGDELKEHEEGEEEDKSREEEKECCDKKHIVNQDSDARINVVTKQIDEGSQEIPYSSGGKKFATSTLLLDSYQSFGTPTSSINMSNNARNSITSVDDVSNRQHKNMVSTSCVFFRIALNILYLFITELAYHICLSWSCNKNTVIYLLNIWLYLMFSFVFRLFQTAMKKRYDLIIALVLLIK